MTDILIKDVRIVQKSLLRPLVFSRLSGLSGLIMTSRAMIPKAHYNKATQRYECLIGERLEGVTAQEIVQHKDMISLFRHVDFTKSRDYVEQLRNEFGLRDALKVVTKYEENEEIAIGIGIKIADDHNRLKIFLESCECMLSEVHFRMSQTLKIRLLNARYRKGSLIMESELSLFALRSFPVFDQQVFKWYIDMYGRERFNHLCDNCKKALAEKTSDMESINNKQLKGSINAKAKEKEIRKFIQDEVMRKVGWIERSDKSIIAWYRGYVKCDKIVDFPGGVDVYRAYRDYVKNIMSKKYRDLMDSLLKMVERAVRLA